MIPTFNKVHNRFKLDNYHYEHAELKDAAYSLVKEGDPYEYQVGEFLLNWLDDSDHIKVKTSGSTGDPITINLSKQVMVNSAINTGDYFNLEPGDRALLCLPARYIAGKMMIVRAIILGLELDTAQPANHVLFKDDKPYEISAMAPIQLKNAISRLDCFKRIIVGGAAVPQSIINSIQDCKTLVYETYGMTETASHIAVKKLNNLDKDEKKRFHCLAGIKVTKDDRDCLVIHSNHLSAEPIITNDMVKIYSETEFDWLGRIDNVINSGGVKLHPETIERKLSDAIGGRFLIASEDEESLGQQVVLILESASDEIDPSVFSVLDKFEIPKKIYAIPEFVETSTKKVNREKTIALLK